MFSQWNFRMTKQFVIYQTALIFENFDEVVDSKGTTKNNERIIEINLHFNVMLMKIFDNVNCLKRIVIPAMCTRMCIKENFENCDFTSTFNNI